MPEIENNQADETIINNSEIENSNSEADQKTDVTTTGGEDNSGGQSEGDNGNPNPSKDKEAPKSQDNSQEMVDDNEEPPVRKPLLSKQDYIIGRQRSKLLKEKEKANDDEGDESDENDEIAPEDEAMITKVVAKHFAPIIQQTLDAEDDKAVNDFLKENPDMRKYESKARRFMKHESRKNIPVESIFYEIAGKEMFKIGADRKSKADEIAKNSQTGGGSNRGNENKKGV